MADAQHLSILNQGVEAWNAWRANNASIVPDLTEAKLPNTELTGINFRSADLRRADLSGARLARADLREANLQAAELAQAFLEETQLQKADLRRTELGESNLQKSKLRGADLREANLEASQLDGADLQDSDLRLADAQDASFRGASLQRANLREADLRGADLSDVKGGLQAEQLAGSDLTGTKLPETLADLFQNLDAAKDITENAQNLFVVMLAGCLYSWLAIATTTDAGLVTNRASSVLPIIQTSIPIVWFYVVSPLVLLAVFFYFHFYLQKLWEELSSLPAIFPDGRSLYTKADPWLLSDLVRSHLPKLSAGRPFMSHLQTWISILLAWWVVPFTLLLFWWRYLPRHDFLGTVFHCGVMAIAVTSAVLLYRLAGATLRGAARGPFVWRSALLNLRAYWPAAATLALAMALVIVSVGAIRGVRSGASAVEWWPQSYGRWTWVPRALARVRYSPFADLRGADLSTKPPTWTGNNDAEVDSVTGVPLGRVDLRYADLRGTFLAKAVLTDAHLKNADLLLADLRKAELVDADLEGADLLGAQLDGANAVNANLAGADLAEAHLAGATLVKADLTGADLADADLTGAEIKFADFTNAKELTAAQLKKATGWEKAFYDAKVLQALGLPPGNNATVREQELAEPKAGSGGSTSDLARVEQLLRSSGENYIEAQLIRTRLAQNAQTPALVQVVAVSSSASTHQSQFFSVLDVARLYNFPAGLDGRGQTIGVIELSGGYRESDLKAYFTGLNLPIPNVTSVSVDGAKNSPTGSPNGTDAEVEMMIEIVGSVVPAAHLVAYFAPNTPAGFLDAIKAAVGDSQNRLSVLVIGWGSPESTGTSQAMEDMNDVFKTATNNGITVLAAAGDNGVTDGVSDGEVHVDFPASSPYVLACGGTRINASGGAIATEDAWNDGTSGGATGGGVSNVFALPDWQSQAGVPIPKSGHPGRGIPDVAANADPVSGYKVYVDGKATVLGGSETATALWAGLIALLDQGLGRNLGYFNPLLYQNIGPAGVLRGILAGQNGMGKVKGYTAGRGWNPVAGWGSPDGTKLLQAIKSALASKT